MTNREMRYKVKETGEKSIKVVDQSGIQTF